MKKNVSTLLLVLAMLVSLASPAFAAGSEPMTRGDLAAYSTEIAVPGTGEETDELTQLDAISFLLRYAGMEESQLGTYPGDYEAMADSLGLTDLIEYDADAVCTEESFEALLNSDCLKALTEALSAETKAPLFLNGMAQPIFPYTSGALEEGYSNADSDIIRYCVYVETNYDTDNDGKLDLVKALIQMPRAVAEGDFQAATIYEARPYITGCTDRGMEYYTEALDYDMYQQPAARDSATATISSWESAQEFVNAADAGDWYYYNPYEEVMVYEDLTWYDYYLVRGYAVVACGGLGTMGSEGFETCGADLEIDAFRCVIEWLTGDRVAYTDAEAATAIEAYWSSQSVGMTGRSYAGTTQYGLASTGVEGLKTVVPVAGISSWYEYTNSQGVSTRSNAAYTNTLAAYCAGRYLDAEDFATIEQNYGRYLNQMKEEQLALNGDYGEHWEIRDYTLQAAENIQCSALIVHGINDYNVRPKNSIMMYETFEQAGAEVKLLLHQDGHLTPTYPAGNLVFKIGDDYYDEILNKWFSHYLYGLENGIQEMAAVTVQDAHEDTWNTYDSWTTDAELALTAAAQEETVSISSDYSVLGASRGNYQTVFGNGSTTGSAMYAGTVEADTVIKGAAAVRFRAATANAEGVETALADRDALMVSAMLIDIAPAGETFDVFNTAGSYVPKTTLAEAGAWMGGGLANFDLVELNTTEVSYKVITRGWMDLCNPEAGYDSASSANGIDLEEGTYYDYTLYLQPNVYEVKAGHTLALVLYAYEPGMASYDENYVITLDNASVSASIPVEGESSALTADYTLVTYTDLEEDWYAEAVEFVSMNKLMDGLTAAEFGPTAAADRASIVSILYKLEGSPKVESESAFTDVTDEDSYASAVKWAYDNGIVLGHGDGTYAPDEAVTREQLVTILHRYAQYKEMDVSVGENTNILSYADAEQVSEWAVAAMQWACGSGVVAGGEVLEPAEDAMRAAVADMIMRFCQL